MDIRLTEELFEKRGIGYKEYFEDGKTYKYYCLDGEYSEKLGFAPRLQYSPETKRTYIGSVDGEIEKWEFKAPIEDGIGLELLSRLVRYHGVKVFSTLFGCDEKKGE